MYDVIVIGAGPAGATSSKILAEKGYNVLLVEKFKLPRYKSCSGVLIKKTVDLIRNFYNEEVPSSAFCEPADNFGMILTDSENREYCFEQDGMNINRTSFDSWLLSKACESGVSVRDSTTAVFAEETDGFLKVSLCTDKKIYTEEAKYIIDCEGAVGSFKKKTFPSRAEHIITFQTFNKGSIDLDFHYFYAYLNREFSEYDAWFNVKDNLMVLGVAVKDNGKIGFYYNNFLSYMKKNHNLQIERQQKAEKWLMPHIRPGCNIDYGKNRILFAGEIAGFLNPMGEGISSAIESGYFAAMAVADYFNSPEDICREYRKNTQGLKNYMLRQWNFVSFMSDRFSEMKL